MRPQRQQPTRLPHPWGSPGKNTGVGCHFLLQCMKVKSESEVAQSCPTPSDPMDCSLPNPLQGNIPTEMKTYAHTKTCTGMFTAVLFIIAPKWKQPKSLSTDEWIGKMWYFRTMEYYSAVKINEVLIYATIWMNNKTMLNKISQTQKATYCVIPFLLKRFRIGKSIETQSKLSCQWLVEGRRRSDC